MSYRKSSRSYVKKSIPTIIGMLILLIALVSGLILFKDGFGSFMPRANPQAVPQDIKITNLTDDSFTISFYTEDETESVIRYGLNSNDLDRQVRDQRNQFKTEASEFNIHYITLNNLEPEKTYYFNIKTDAGIILNENNKPYSVQTTKRNDQPKVAKTIFGSIFNSYGAPASGALVYVKIPGFEELSALVKSSGSWAISLSDAISVESQTFAEVPDKSQLNMVVKGVKRNEYLVHQTTLDRAQPVENLTLLSEDQVINRDEEKDEEDNDEVVDQGEVQGVSNQLEQDNDSNVLDLANVAEGQYLQVNQTSIIRGLAAELSEVRVTLIGEKEFSYIIKADRQGFFEVNLQELKGVLDAAKYGLKYSYNDPELGLEVTREYSFVVNESSQEERGEVLGDEDEIQDYGSSNPYTVDVTPTMTPTPIPTQMPIIEPTKVVEQLPEAGSNSGIVMIILSTITILIGGVWAWSLKESIQK